MVNMKWKLVFLFLAVVAAGAEDGEENVDETSEESVREIRKYNQENWRAVETYPEGNSGWIPHDQPQEHKPKRRRLRKRKRRPPIYLQDDSTDETFVGRPLRRRIRPYRLEHNQEPWEEMTDDVVNKPNIRRRVTPIYKHPEETTEDVEARNPSFSFPSVEEEPFDNPSTEDIPVKEENETTEQINPISDLKMLLKQSGGPLSLSEILQQKNLSLAELLNGNEKAISALTEKPQEVTEQVLYVKPSDSELSAQYSRKPPSVGHKRTTERVYIQEEDSEESLSTKEKLEAQRKRLVTQNSPKDRTFSTITKLDVINEPTTERRIFVPSHPKYYTSLSYKPDFSANYEQSTESVAVPTTTTSTEKPKEIKTTIRTKLKAHTSLPATNAKLKQTTKTTLREKENYPLSFEFPKYVKINLNEIGLKNNNSKEATNTVVSQKEISDTPLRMPIEIDVIIEKTELDSKTQIPTSTEVASENMTYVTAREEIMEILKDPETREKLSRILEFRNMTVEELVEQRERGSSQLHLADIFHNKTREPEPKDEPFIGLIDNRYFSQVLERQQKSRKFDAEAGTQIPTSDLSSLKNDIESPKPSEYSSTEVSTIKKEVNKSHENKIQPFPWKQLYPDILTDIRESSDNDINLDFPHLQHSTEEYFIRDVQGLEDVDDIVSLSSDERLNLDEINSEQEAFFKIPSGVKSAIFVSLAIIGISIIVFLTILVIFKWSQKQKRINYCSSLSTKLRSQMILQGPSRSAIKTFVNETLGRKKNYYKSNVQRMCDDMWEGDRERKPSF